MHAYSCQWNGCTTIISYITVISSNFIYMFYTLSIICGVYQVWSQGVRHWKNISYVFISFWLLYTWLHEYMKKYFLCIYLISVTLHVVTCIIFFYQKTYITEGFLHSYSHWNYFRLHSGYYEWCIYIWNHMLMMDKFGWYWNVLKHLIISVNCMSGQALQGSINIYFAFNTLRQRQNGCYFPDDIFKCIFLNENVWIAIKISLKFVPKGPISNIAALVEIMASRWPGHKLFSEPMEVSLLTRICVTRPQWVNYLWSKHAYMYPYLGHYWLWQCFVTF